ncbi:hypothetical protein [Nocardioides dilutus]
MPTVDSDDRGSRDPRLPPFVLGGSLVIGLVFLASQARQLYFFGDDWAFLLGRTLSWPELMQPHNEHWSTLPLITFRTMFHVFGIDHYLAYALMPILLHLGCCALIYSLMRRHDIAAWPAALCTVPMVFLCGNIGENPLWDFQIGFLGSAALGLIALHLLRDGGRRHVALAWLVTVVGLMCSGMALPMLTWVGAYVLLARGLARALVSTVPPALVYLAWHLAFGADAAGQSPTATADQTVSFVATGLAHVWQEMLRMPVVGGVAIIGLAGFALLARLTARQQALALSGVMTIGVTYVMLAISRAGLGPGAATASRYVYFGVLFTLPVFALLVSRVADELKDHPLRQRTAGAVLVVALVANGVAQTLAFTEGRTQLTDGLKGRVLATVELLHGDERFLGQQVSLPYSPDITVDALARPEVQDALPDDAVGPAQLLEASAALQVAASADGYDLPPASGLRLHGISGTPNSGGCAELQAARGAWIDLPASPEGSQVQLTTSATEYVAQLLDGRLVSTAVTLPNQPRVPTYVASTSRRGTLRVNVPAGALQLCLAKTE